MNKNRKYIMFSGAIVLLTFISIYTYLSQTFVPMPPNGVHFPFVKKWSCLIDDNVVDLSATDNGTVVFARTNKALYALRASTGNLLWGFILSSQVQHSPAIALDGKVYITDSGSLWALDQESGQIVWSQSLPESSGRVVAVSKDVILVQEVAYEIRAYNPDMGALLWHLPIQRVAQASIDDNLVYILDDNIKAVDSLTGKTIWEKIIGTTKWTIYWDGVLYYGKGDTYNIRVVEMVAFDIRQQAELWKAKPILSKDDISGQRVLGNFLFAYNPGNIYMLNKLNGSVVWQTKISQPINPVVIGDRVFVMEGFSRIIRSFQMTTGKESGSLQTSLPQLSFMDNQDMTSVGNLLVFSRGKELFAYGE